MSVSRGNLQGGVQGSEVDLLIPRGEVGDVVSIHLSQEATSRASWLIQVRAGYPDGGFEIVGNVRTFAPGPGEPAGRAVGWAFIPGACAWAISAYAKLPAGDPGRLSDERALCTLHSSKSTGSLAAGVHSVLGGSSEVIGKRVFVRESDIAISPVSEALPGSTLWNLWAALQEQVAGANTWVEAFDTLAAPGAGAVPFWSGHVGQAAGGPPDPSNIRIPIGPLGRRLRNGLWVSTSLVGDILTPDGAHHLNITTELSQGGL